MTHLSFFIPTYRGSSKNYVIYVHDRIVASVDGYDFAMSIAHGLIKNYFVVKEDIQIYKRDRTLEP